ncbi:hypothetical protein ECDEC7E_2694 [Escherichia coli DEC7E]|nr:hypothetical protein ECDEC7E_2694 [Escherichia coli DEC7E]
MPENPASYRVVRKKSYLFNKAIYMVYLSNYLKGSSDFLIFIEKMR